MNEILDEGGILVGKRIEDLSLLVVDDNEINLMLMEDIFEMMNVGEVKTIDSGIDAVDEIEKNPNYDMIVMDICMPGMDGYEASKKIRQLGYTGRIVALTANVLTTDDTEFKEAMMDDVLLKPVDLDMIRKVLCFE
ncbi:MAG: response regulator [Turicibacter sp.]|nr:response regulator [Turicibacter sp.]